LVVDEFRAAVSRTDPMNLSIRVEQPSIAIPTKIRTPTMTLTAHSRLLGQTGKDRRWEPWVAMLAVSMRGPRLSVGLVAADSLDESSCTILPDSSGQRNKAQTPSSHSKAATVSASPATSLADAAGSTVTAAPTATVATSSKTARPTMTLDRAQAAPIVVVAGPLPLTTVRWNLAGQSASRRPRAASALRKHDS
jgi:hypothetical protein